MLVFGGRLRMQVMGRMDGFWGQIAISLRSEAKHPKGGPKARGICALTPKTPDSDLSAVSKGLVCKWEWAFFCVPVPLNRRGGRLTFLCFAKET